jgi:hypothetical protein
MKGEVSSFPLQAPVCVFFRTKHTKMYVHTVRLRQFARQGTPERSV